MKHIDAMFENLWNEGYDDTRLVVYREVFGWYARVVDGQTRTLLCPAGHSFLSVSEEASPEDAIAELDNLVKQGFERAAQEAAEA
jgi:hypothetical protein